MQKPAALSFASGAEAELRSTDSLQIRFALRAPGPASMIYSSPLEGRDGTCNAGARARGRLRTGGDSFLPRPHPCGRGHSVTTVPE